MRAGGRGRAHTTCLTHACARVFLRACVCVCVRMRMYVYRHHLNTTELRQHPFASLQRLARPCNTTHPGWNLDPRRSIVATYNFHFSNAQAIWPIFFFQCGGSVRRDYHQWPEDFSSGRKQITQFNLERRTAHDTDWILRKHLIQLDIHAIGSVGLPRSLTLLPKASSLCHQLGSRNPWMTFPNLLIQFFPWHPSQSFLGENSECAGTVLCTNIA